MIIGQPLGDLVDEQNNLRAMAAWLDTVIAGAPDVARFWAPDSVVEIPSSLPYGGRLTLAGHGRYAQDLHALWEIHAPARPETRAAGDAVYVHARWHATARATGITVDQPLLEVFTFADGRIRHSVQHFFDTAALVAALGTRAGTPA